MYIIPLVLHKEKTAIENENNNNKFKNRQKLIFIIENNIIYRKDIGVHLTYFIV